MTMTVTNVDNGRVVNGEAKYRDELITFPGADTYVEGTLLARRAVANAITPAAGGGNTGNGTCTLATVAEGPVVPLVGTYVLTCIAAVTNGGVFNLKDPNGAIVADYLALTVGAGASTAFEVAGLKFTVTDGSTDFVAGDLFNLPVVADGKLVAYAIGGDGGAQFPIAVLTYELTATGAGDKKARVMVAGEVKKSRLVVDADGDDSNITAAILDQLRSAGIVATDVQQLSVLDNQ